MLNPKNAIRKFPYFSNAFFRLIYLSIPYEYCYSRRGDAFSSCYRLLLGNSLRVTAEWGARI